METPLKFFDYVFLDRHYTTDSGHMDNDNAPLIHPELDKQNEKTLYQ